MMDDYKVHLIGSEAHTKCGKGLDEVQWDIYYDTITCKNCIRIKEAEEARNNVKKSSFAY